MEMDDVKITIRTTIEGTATETTYVQQMPAHNQQSNACSECCASSSCCRTPVVEENKYITIKSPIIGTFIEKSDKPMFVEVELQLEKVTFFV
jgi:acetyl-CoA carboxylase biotin carboxyl carrier protein